MLKVPVRVIGFAIITLLLSCNFNVNKQKSVNSMKASQILGNPNYLAISYGGYRTNSRDVQPTISELKEDMLILEAAGIRIVRTYNLQYAKASNVVKAIHELKKENSSFEMYVMLGAWIDCKDAWTSHPVSYTHLTLPTNREV